MPPDAQLNQYKLFEGRPFIRDPASRHGIARSGTETSSVPTRMALIDDQA
jgi:hypothetical protein